MVDQRRVRLGLIGAGRWGQKILRTVVALRDRCELTHLVTRYQERAALVPYPVTVSQHWRDLVTAPCDAVIIATPPNLHAEMIEACLEQRKPCLVAKPLCLDLETAEHLQARIETSHVPVLVDHTFLFHPAYKALKDALRLSGEIIRVVISEGIGLGPFRSDTPAWWDWGPHDISLCLDLLGDMPTHIAALAGPRDTMGHPEQLSVRLEFAQGTSAWIYAGRLGPQKCRRLAVFTEQSLYRWDGLGTPSLMRGSCDFNHRYAGTGWFDDLQFEEVAIENSGRPLDGVLTYFLDGLAGGDRHYFGSMFGREVIRVLDACDRAMAVPSTVSVS